MEDSFGVTPPDSHNQALMGNVRPAGWQNPTPKGRYNLVVIGAGTAGLVCAAGAAGLGAEVALIEKHLFGGDCLNTGCVPSKCLIRSARLVGELRRAADLGVKLPPGARADFPAVMERMRRLRARISEHDSVERFAHMGVDIYLGQGRFTGPETVEVEGKTLAFSRAVIATGSTPGGLPFPGLKEAGYLTNETIFSLTELPLRLAVLGTGPIGCELAQAFARFGSRVLMVGRSADIMTKEDPEAAQMVAQAMRRDGVDLRLLTTVEKVSLQGGEKLIHLKSEEKTEVAAVDEILVGAGRKPVVQGLELEKAGVKFDPKAGVHVDDHLRTTNPRIFAAGDVCLAHKFTHTAEAAARIVLQNALFAGRAKVSALTVPWCTYTDPEAAHVGTDENQARRQGMEVEVFKVPFDDLDRAIADQQEQGFVKIMVKRGTDKIVGAVIVAAHAGEMISEISVAMAGGVGLKALANVIHPYPTQAEAIKKAADAFNRTRLTPGVQKWISRWLAWRR